MSDTTQVVWSMVFRRQREFTPQGRQIVKAANTKGDLMGVYPLCSVHILLGWLRIYSKICPACAKHGLGYADICEKSEAILLQRDNLSAFQLPRYSTRYYKLIFNAIRNARSMNQHFTGGHNILNALVADDKLWSDLNIEPKVVHQFATEVYEELLKYWAAQRAEIDDSESSTNTTNKPTTS